MVGLGAIIRGLANFSNLQYPLHGFTCAINTVAKLIGYYIFFPSFFVRKLLLFFYFVRSKSPPLLCGKLRRKEDLFNELENMYEMLAFKMAYSTLIHIIRN